MDIMIQGCRGGVPDTEAFVASLQDFAAAHDIACQAFDADAVYGTMHLRSAVQHAVRSFRRGDAVCNDLSMEILLYASGCRQIRDAIERVGVRNGDLVLLAVGRTDIPGADGDLPDMSPFMDEHSLASDDDVLAGTDATLDRFGILADVREAIDTSMYEDLILEQVAMVDLQK
ncbi:MAG: KEOPS complex subunit Cgi121 [Thermoplasmatota archaeon]